MSFGTGTDEGNKPMEVRNKKNGSPKCRGGSTITGTIYASSQQATCAFSHSIQRKFNSSHASTWGLIVRSSRYNFFLLLLLKGNFNPYAENHMLKYKFKPVHKFIFIQPGDFVVFNAWGEVWKLMAPIHFENEEGAAIGLKEWWVSNQEIKGLTLASVTA